MLCPLFLVLNSHGQEPLPQFSYLDSLDNDTLAVVKLNQLLKNNQLKEIEKGDLYVKLLMRYSNMEKFDTVVALANKFILQQQNKSKVHLPRYYGFKGTAYYYLYNLQKSEESNLRALAIAEETKNYKYAAKMCNNLGGILVEQNRFKEAEKTLKRSLNLNKTYVDTINEQYFQSMRILATLYELMKENKMADSLYATCLAGFEKIKSFNGPYNGVLNFYASFLSKQGQPEKAKLLFDKSIATIKKDAFKQDFSALYYNASIFYRGIKDYETSVIYYDSAFHSQREDFNRRHADEIAASETKFKTHVLQSDLKIEKEKKSKWIFAFLLLFALGTAAYTINYINIKKKLAHNKLIQQQLTTNAFMEGEENEKTRLSRELHDGIGQELLALSMQLKKDGNNPLAVKALETIGVDVRNLSHQLMPLTLQLLGLVPSMEEICNKLLVASNIQYHLDANTVTERLSEKLEISLYRIFQELIQNIVKHSQATAVSIQLIRLPQFINLIVEDNGVGFQEKKNSNGIGLSNLNTRVQIMNGQMNYESMEGDGTTVIVRIPI